MVIKIILDFDDATLIKKYLQLFNSELLKNASQKSPQVYYGVEEIKRLINELGI